MRSIAKLQNNNTKNCELSTKDKETTLKRINSVKRITLTNKPIKKTNEFDSTSQTNYFNEDLNLLKKNKLKFLSNDSLNYKSKNILSLTEKTLKKTTESSSLWFLQHFTGDKKLAKNKSKKKFFF